MFYIQTCALRLRFRYLKEARAEQAKASGYLFIDVSKTEKRSDEALIESGQQGKRGCAYNGRSFIVLPKRNWPEKPKGLRPRRKLFWVVPPCPKAFSGNGILLPTNERLSSSRETTHTYLVYVLCLFTTLQIATVTATPAVTAQGQQWCMLQLHKSSEIDSGRPQVNFFAVHFATRSAQRGCSAAQWGCLGVLVEILPIAPNTTDNLNIYMRTI